MLQTWNLETSVFVPIHVVFEHRASDAYELEESALPATSPPHHGKQNEPAATRLWENSELSAYEPGERVWLAAPLMLNETSLALPAPLKENDVAEQEEKMPAVESGVQQERVALTQVKFRQAVIEVDDPAV